MLVHVAEKLRSACGVMPPEPAALVLPGSRDQVLRTQS